MKIDPDTKVVDLPSDMLLDIYDLLNRSLMNDRKDFHVNTELTEEFRKVVRKELLVRMKR